MTPERRLDKAVRAGDIRRVEELLDLQPNLLNCRGGLWSAASTGQLAMVQWFVRRGADPDYRSAERDTGFGTPLLVAAKHGHIDVARWLAANGATLDILALAALGEVDQVTRVLDTDPDSIHATYGTGHPTIELGPMDFAHCSGTVDMFRLLLERGAQPTAMHVSGCLERENLDAAHLLMSRLDWREDESMQAVFTYAARTATSLSFLLAQGVSLNARRHANGEHAGHFHVRKANHPALELVLDGGIEIDAQRKDGGTMLHTAVRMGLARFVTTLMDRGARYDIRDHRGTRRTKLSAPSTPMDYAHARKSPRMAELLLQKIEERRERN